MIVICYYLSRKIPSPFGKRASQGRRKPPCGSTGRISRTARGPIGIQCFLVPPCGRPFRPHPDMKIRTRLHGRGPAVPGPCAVPVSISNPVRNASPSHAPTVSMDAIKVEASADASASGLPSLCRRAGGARGGRVGLLGTRDLMDTPFSITSYTNELIQDRQARSVGDVLQNDSGMRGARLRQFPGVVLHPRLGRRGLQRPVQPAAAPIHRHRVVRAGGGAARRIHLPDRRAVPNGGGIGGVINLVPKRAQRAADPPDHRHLQRRPVSDFHRHRAPLRPGRQLRRAPERGAAQRRHRHRRRAPRTSLVSLGLDWRSADTRLSADVGWQENKLKRARPNVSFAPGLKDHVPAPPDASSNYAQPWSYPTSVMCSVRCAPSMTSATS